MLADAASSSWLCLTGSMCSGSMFPNERVRGSRVDRDRVALEQGDTK